MISAKSLETLQRWLEHHSIRYLLAFGRGGFTTPDAVRELAETCDELEIEDHRVDMTWTTRTASLVQSKFESVIAIADLVNPRIQLESRPLTFEEHMERSPGGLELSGGYLGSDIEEAFTLLDITLETFGLLRVVRRAPRELWEKALEESYKERQMNV